MRSSTKKLIDSKVIAHLVRAHERYWTRLGNQLAGSIAFTSMLAMVPLVMFAFSGVGFTLTVLRPQWMSVVEKYIKDNLNAGPLQDQVLFMIDRYLHNWGSVGIVALVVALFLGSTFVGNLKTAIRGMSRANFNIPQPKYHPILEYIINVGLVFVLIILLAFTFSTTAVGTQLATNIVEWLKVSSVLVSEGFVSVASLLLSVAGSTFLFFLVFRFFPERPPHPVALRRASLGAGISFVALQALASYLTGFFWMGKASQIFGPVIISMIFINLFAQSVLYWTAWLGTWNQPAVAGRYTRADEILRNDPATELAPDHWEQAEREKQRREADKQTNQASISSVIKESKIARLKAEEALAAQFNEDELVRLGFDLKEWRRQSHKTSGGDAVSA